MKKIITLKTKHTEKYAVVTNSSQLTVSCQLDDHVITFAFSNYVIMGLDTKKGRSQIRWSDGLMKHAGP